MRRLFILGVALAGCATDPLPPDGPAHVPADAAAVDTAVAGDAAEPTDLATCPGPPDLPLAPPPAPLPFDAPALYFPKGDKRSLAVGDVTGDGRPDLVVPNLIAVLARNQAGGFDAPVLSPTALFSYDGALADFDGDGKLDVVAAEEDLNSFLQYVGFYRGRGDGTFANGPRFLVSKAEFDGAFDMVAADFDGDGKLDLAWIQGSHPFGPIRLRLGDGGGGFLAPKGAPPVEEVGSFAAADLDGDSFADLVAGSVTDGRVSVYHGRGDGSFDAAALYGTKGMNAYRLPVAVGDLDGDGKLDVAAGLDAATLTLLPGHGDGTFGAPSTVAAGVVLAGEIRIADVDGDGRSDLVVADDARWGGDDVAFLRGLGGFAFAPPALRPAGSSPRDLAVADFDGDGRADVALLGSLGIAILPGTADGAPRTTRDEPTGPHPMATALGDFDGDGALDVAVASTGGLDANGKQTGQGLYLHRGRGDGTFAPPTTPYVSDEQRALAAADFDRDGHLDLALLDGWNPMRLRILLGRGDGTFAAPSSTALPSSEAIAVADFDADGAPDLALVDWPTGEVRLLLGRGDGTFTTTVWPGIDGAWVLAVGDFDGDHHVDVAAGAGDYHHVTGGALVVLRGDGHGAFAPPEMVVDGPSVVALAAADLDGDGQDELLADGVDYPPPVYVARRACNGAWSFDKVAELERGTRALALADLDGDGRLDLLAPQPGIPCIDRCGQDGVAVLLSRGGAVFGEPRYYPTGYEPRALAVGDLDGDGRPDAVTANIAGTFTVLRNLP